MTTPTAVTEAMSVIDRAIIALKHRRIELANELRHARAALEAALAAPGPDEGAEAVAWCKLTPSGNVAHFDGKPMFMAGKAGNEHHPTPLYTRPHPPAQPEGDAAQNAPDAVSPAFGPLESGRQDASPADPLRPALMPDDVDAARQSGAQEAEDAVRELRQHAEECRDFYPEHANTYDHAASILERALARHAPEASAEDAARRCDKCGEPTMHMGGRCFPCTKATRKGNGGRDE